MRQIIELRGGAITPMHECFTYQIADEEMFSRSDPETYGKKNFYPGKVYSANWIRDSIAKGHLLSERNYLVCIVRLHETRLRTALPMKGFNITKREVLVILNFADDLLKGKTSIV